MTPSPAFNFFGFCLSDSMSDVGNYNYFSSYARSLLSLFLSQDLNSSGTNSNGNFCIDK